MAPVDRLRSALLLLALVSPTACTHTVTADDDGGAAPGPVPCDESEEPLALDDEVLGFSPADVLARFGGVHQVTLEYYQAGTTELTLELTLTGQAAHVSTSDPEGVDPADILGPCGQAYMRLPLELRFTTADGAFDERIAVRWELGALDEFAQINADIDLGALQGSYTADADKLSFVVYFSEDEPSGAVIGVLEPEDELPTEFNVARFNSTTWPQTE